MDQRHQIFRTRPDGGVCLRNPGVFLTFSDILPDVQNESVQGLKNVVVCVFHQDLTIAIL